MRKISKINIKKILFVFVTIFLVATIIPLNAHASFSILAAPVKPNTDTVIKLDWTSVPKAYYYTIYRDDRQIRTINIDVDRNYLTFTDERLTPGTSYEYRIVAMDSGRNIVDEAITKASTTKMLRPTDVAIEYNQVSKRVTLKWRTNSNAATRTIIMRNDGKEITQLGASTNSYTFYDTALDENSRIQYTIISADGYGNKSDPSEPAVLKAVEVPVITASIENGIATITWDEDVNVANYYLERSRHNGVTWSDWQVVSAHLTKERKSITESPKEGGTYRYRLNNKGWGGYSVLSNVSEPVTKPAAPEDIVCNVNTNATVTISWKNNTSNISSLKVQRKSSEGSYIDIASLSHHATSYTDQFVSSATSSYTYRIIAWESENNFDISKEAVVSMGRPFAPSGLSMTVLSNNTIFLEWKDNSNNETGFKVERKTDSDDYIEIAVLSANKNSHIDYNLTLGHLYTYRVKAYNPYGDSLGFSNPVSARTDDLIDAPDSLTIIPVSATQIDLSWTYPGYRSYNSIVERKKAIIDDDGNEGDWEKIASLVSGDTNYSDTSLEPNSKYFYRVRAVMGAYLFSSPYPGGDAGQAVYTKLNAPSELTAIAVTPQRISLNWKDNSDETEFVIERKTGESSFITAAYVYENQIQWADESVIPNTKYTYRVKALTHQNESNYSEEVSVISQVLEAPTELDAVVVSHSLISLSWKDNSDRETGFELWRKKGESGQWTMIKTLGRDIQSTQDTKVEPDTWYYYKLAAYTKNVLGEVRSAFSEEVTVKTSVPSSPSDIIYHIVSADKVLIQWTEQSNINAEYEVQRKEGEYGQWESKAFLPSGLNSFIDEGLEPYIPYFYRIATHNNEFGSQSISDEIEVITGAPMPPSHLNVKVLSPKMITLVWEDNSFNEQGFIIERRTYFGGFGVLEKVAKDTTSFTDSTLLPDTRYYYRLKAYNLSGDSDYCDEVYARTKQSITFDDIRELYWAKDAIEDLAGRGIIRGKTDKLFAPNDSITRAEFTALVVRAFGLHDIPVGNFFDVKVNHWAYREIIIARNFGIVESDSENMFYPDKVITREEMATIAVKAAMAVNKPLPYHDISVLDKFIDRNSVSEEALYSMASLCGEGIINGRTEYTIDPKDTSTRAEAAVVLYKVLERVE